MEVQNPEQRKLEVGETISDSTTPFFNPYGRNRTHNNTLIEHSLRVGGVCGQGVG